MTKDAAALMAKKKQQDEDNNATKKHTESSLSFHIDEVTGQQMIKTDLTLNFQQKL